MRLQLFGESELEQFEIFRKLNSGDPIAVATTSASFSPHSKDSSLRVIQQDMTSNFPLNIATYAIDSN